MFGDQDRSNIFKKTNKESKTKEILFNILLLNYQGLRINGYFLIFVFKGNASK